VVGVGLAGKNRATALGGTNPAWGMARKSPSFQVATKLRSPSLPPKFDPGCPTPIVIGNVKQSWTDQSSTMSCSKRSRTDYKFATLPCLLGHKIFCRKQRDIDVMLHSPRSINQALQCSK
jgi:hypothetical protein